MLPVIKEIESCDLDRGTKSEFSVEPAASKETVVSMRLYTSEPHGTTKDRKGKVEVLKKFFVR